MTGLADRSDAADLDRLFASTFPERSCRDRVVRLDPVLGEILACSRALRPGTSPETLAIRIPIEQFT